MTADTFVEQVQRAMDHFIQVAHVAAPDELPLLLSESASAFGAPDAGMFLADLQQRTLIGFEGPGHQLHPYAEPLGIDSTIAGRAFQHMQRVTQAAVESHDERTRVWLPLLDGTERFGVLGLTLAREQVEDDAGMTRLQRFASVVTEVLMSKAQYGDSIVNARRTRPMTLAAEIQWSLLPPLTFVNHSVSVTGGLEPAYEVAGDSLDYAISTDQAHFGVFDGMGHGIISAQLISLVVAAYRNARRAGLSLVETAAHIEDGVHDVFRTESFATGVLCELDTATGVLSWVSAGHHEPLLLRGGHLVRALKVDPLLPFGLNKALSPGTSPPVGTEHLEPGDIVLLYTDGVLEARSPDGEFFGQERLVDMIVRNLASGLPTPEVLRRVVHALLAHQADSLEDDATLLLVEWHGAGAPLQDPELSLTGRRAIDPPLVDVAADDPSVSGRGS